MMSEQGTDLGTAECIRSHFYQTLLSEEPRARKINMVGTHFKWILNIKDNQPITHTSTEAWL